MAADELLMVRDARKGALLTVGICCPHSPGGQMMVAHLRHQRLPTNPAQALNAMKNDQILSQISEFCRRADMAESTFGRRAANDGKLVQRLPERKRITIDTLDRIQSYITASVPRRATRAFDALAEKRAP